MNVFLSGLAKGEIWGSRAADGRVELPPVDWDPETGQPVEDFVRRRHAFHRLYGKRNPEIFALIAGELAGRLVAAPPLSERQLRRIIYG